MMNRASSLLSLLALSLCSVSAFAADPVTNIAQVGSHHRALVIEKSINRQNILVAYTKLDENCDMVSDRANRGLPLFNFYWLNDRKSYEPLDSSMGTLIRGRLTVDPASEADTLQIELTDLKTMKHDLPSRFIVLTSKRETLSRKCEVEATIEMGPSDHKSVAVISSIYLEMGMMGGVNAITINGKTKITGRPISRRFAAAASW